MGSALHITLPSELKSGASVAVKVTYETTHEGTALQWLEKEWVTFVDSCYPFDWTLRRQTQGKTFPYLFSQCQPIYGRTLAPLQGLRQLMNVLAPWPPLTFTSRYSFGQDCTQLYLSKMLFANHPPRNIVLKLHLYSLSSFPQSAHPHLRTAQRMTVKSLAKTLLPIRTTKWAHSSIRRLQNSQCSLSLYRFLLTWLLLQLAMCVTVHSLNTRIRNGKAEYGLNLNWLTLLIGNLAKIPDGKFCLTICKGIWDWYVSSYKILGSRRENCNWL